MEKNGSGIRCQNRSRNIQVPEDKVKAKVEQGWVTLEGEVEWNFQKGDHVIISCITSCGKCDADNSLYVIPAGSVEKIMSLTNEKGVDTAIETVGVPATFELCEAIIGAGGHIANIGVHGKPVSLHLET